MRDEPQTDRALRRTLQRGRLRRLSAIALHVVLVLALVGGGVYAVIKHQTRRFTSETQRVLPRVESPRTKRVVAETKMKSARLDAVRELTLTCDEINALVHKEPRLRGAVYVRLEDGLIQADVSLPADVLPGGNGRYINGEVCFAVELEEGRLRLTVASASVDGQAVPTSMLAPVRNRDFARPLYNDSEMSQLLENVERVEVLDDALRFHLKADPNATQLARVAQKGASRGQIN